MDSEFLRTLDRQILLGVFVAFVVVSAGVAYYVSTSKKRRGCLDPENFKEFKLVKKQKLSHNVAKFIFELPTPTSVLGLPIGQHISCWGQDAQGEEVIKPYTPTTLDSDAGRFELVIKMYPQGRKSHHFREMRVGDNLAVKGPKGRFKYQPGQYRAFGMLAEGSGIIPMFQVAREILENPTDKTKVHLIYANVTYEDILLKVDRDRYRKISIHVSNIIGAEYNDIYLSWTKIPPDVCLSDRDGLGTHKHTIGQNDGSGSSSSQRPDDSANF